MKDFDINKIGKKMPYQAPDPSFFEDFTDQLLEKVAPKPKKQFWLGRTLTPLLGVAAAVAVILTITFNKDLKSSGWNNGYIITDNIDESIDSFLGNLSDEDLAYLAMDSSYHDDFFTNLPN